jgi:hypothetical protein
MAGVQNFVYDKRGGTPPPPQSGPFARPDRKDAQKLKLPSKRTVNSARAITTLPSLALTPGYNSNNAGRNVFSNQQFVTQQENHNPIRGTFDVGIDSDFDETRSDVNFEQHRRKRGSDEEDGYDFEADVREAVFSEEEARYFPRVDGQTSLHFRQHKLNHKHSQSPMIPAEVEQATPKKQTAISGRFQGQNADLQLRPSHDDSFEGQPNGNSKKRGRSSEPAFGNQQHLPPRSPPLFEDELPRHGLAANEDQDIQDRKQGDGQNQFDILSDDAGSTTDGGSPSRQRRPRNNRLQQDPPIDLSDNQNDSRLDPDYGDDELRGMTYPQLKAQSWEDVPNAPQLKVPKELQGRDVSLGEQIEFYSKHGDETAQAEFFGSISTSEWEHAGDIFLEKFADLLKKFKDARQAKRNMVAQFEAEIEAREKAVRGKSDILEKEFKEMKASGESVLRGKLV